MSARSLPVHGNRDLKPGLARRIARDAGLDWNRASWITSKAHLNARPNGVTAESRADEGECHIEDENGAASK
jgi:hypothetical protein